MKRRSNIERMKKMMEEMRMGKPMPKKKPSKKKEEPKPKPDMDLNDDGKVDAADVEMVKKEARKKKVVKND